MRVLGLAAALAMITSVGACERADDRAAARNLPHFDLKYCAAALDSPADLPVEACMVSPQKAFALVMGKTGALAVSPASPGGTLGAPIWTSAAQAPENDRAAAVLQEDGNLVVYDLGKPIWNSETPGPGGTYHLELTDAGELLLHGPDGVVTWSSKSGKAAKPQAGPAA